MEERVIVMALRSLKCKCQRADSDLHLTSQYFVFKPLNLSYCTKEIHEFPNKNIGSKSVLNVHPPFKIFLQWHCANIK